MHVSEETSYTCCCVFKYAKAIITQHMYMMYRRSIDMLALKRTGVKTGAIASGRSFTHTVPVQRTCMRSAPCQCACVCALGADQVRMMVSVALGTLRLLMYALQQGVYNARKCVH